MEQVRRNSPFKWLVSLVATLLVLAFSGCGPAVPASGVCEDSDECEEGLECLSTAVWDGDECSESSQVCSIECEDDSDCEELGDDFKCFERCDDGATCTRAAAG